jgi:hypothetical protein
MTQASRNHKTSGGPPMHLTTERSPYPAEVVRTARAAWPMRAAEELRSALIYRAAARAACVVAPSWAEPLRAVHRDELRHVRLCRDLGLRLGAGAPRFDASPVRARLAALPAPRLRLLSLLLVEVAMGETISTALFRAGRRDTREPLARAALSEIVGDEVRHAVLGWRALGALWPSLSAAERRALQQEAGRGLATLERQIAIPALWRLEEAAAFDPALAELGVLAPARRVEAFYEALERQVMPRLRALGLDADGAWAARYRS